MMMRTLPSLTASLMLASLLAGCRHAPAPLTPPPAVAATDVPAPVLVGGDRDAHGCIGSAGYRWCPREAACTRPWELARDKALANSAEAFDAYCAGDSH